ncbi:MAG: PPC domain-containing protein [Myxococcales bacterium]
MSPGTVNRKAALLSLLVLTACPPDVKLPPQVDAGPSLLECSTRQDCTANGQQGRICSPNGRCERCTSDGQCDLRELCDPTEQVCRFKAGWGNECALNADCSVGRLCVQGLCKLEQDVALCQGGRCLADGQRCNQVNLVCEEDIGCLTNDDCSPDELCNLPTNQCVLRCTVERQGELCAPGQKCVSDRCTDCADNHDCPGGLVCDVGKLRCVSDGSARCVTNRDCQVGLVCNRATGFCTAKQPPCRSNEDCLSDERCDVPSGACLRKACQPDRYEKNDDVQTATQLFAGNYPNLTLCGGEFDWYRFALQRGDHLDVFIDADPLLQDVMDARLLDDTGRIMTRGNLVLDRTVSRDGDYYLRMQSSDEFVVYGLRISISRGTPCDDDAYEPNDDRLTAAPITSAGEYDKLTMCPQDTDWFVVDVPANNGIKVELHSVPTEGDLDLYVYSDDGFTQLGSSVTTAAVEEVRVERSAIRNGKVSVKVATQDTRTRNEYFLRVSYLPPQP